AAAMPERGARMPIRSGLFCAIAGANTPNAATADADATNLRRDSAIVVLPLAALWTAFSVHQTHVSNKRNRMKAERAMRPQWCAETPRPAHLLASNRCRNLRRSPS